MVADDDEQAEVAAPPKKPKASKPAPGPTSGAKAAANGDGAIPRSDTPRKPLVDGGVGLLHWNVAGLNALLKDEEKRAE